VNGYIPREGDVVTFLLWPRQGSRPIECTVTTVWADGAECTLHRYADGDDYVYPAMSVTEMREQGVTLIRQGHPADSETRAADAAARQHAARLSGPHRRPRQPSLWEVAAARHIRKDPFRSMTGNRGSSRTSVAPAALVAPRIVTHKR